MTSGLHVLVAFAIVVGACAAGVGLAVFTFGRWPSDRR